MRMNMTVNEVPRTFDGSPHETLLTLLRREGYIGAKRVCESGECGACAVILDGRAVDSCIMLAAQAQESNVTTVEGLGDLNSMSVLQQEFSDNGAIQCGFCIPGMIVTAASLLADNPDPTEDEVRHAFVGNLCRCTGYVKPVEAVLAAARRLR